MRKISAVGLGLNLLLVNVAWSADLPSRKDEGCACRLHVERPAVALNSGAGWTPVAELAAVEQVPEGRTIASNDAGLSTAAFAPGWRAHWAAGLPPLREGDLISVKQGGVAHLSWPDGSTMVLPEGVTRIDAELCKKGPVAGAFPASAALLGGLAAGGIAASALALKGDGGVDPNIPTCTTNCQSSR
jgi:hypothetical protein